MLRYSTILGNIFMRIVLSLVGFISFYAALTVGGWIYWAIGGVCWVAAIIFSIESLKAMLKKK